MKSRFRNLKLALSSWPSLLSGLVIGGGFWWLIESYTHRDFIAGNYGVVYGTVNLIIDIISTILIVLFVASFVYKLVTFRTTRSTNRGGWFGGILAALIGGCGCSVTLATLLGATTFGTMIGLSKFFAFLPFGGLELKILGVLVLGWSIWVNIKNLLICKVKLRNKSFTQTV